MFVSKDTIAIGRDGDIREMIIKLIILSFINNQHLIITLIG